MLHRADPNGHKGRTAVEAQDKGACLLGFDRGTKPHGLNAQAAMRPKVSGQNWTVDSCSNHSPDPAQGMDK
jgi:hypothetical protein